MGDLANEIESLYPGHVRAVNEPLFDATGRMVTDADILLKNAVIQVKSGTRAAGILGQLVDSEAATGLPSIGYGPKFSGATIRTLSQQGGLVTSDKALLLELIRP